MSILQCIAGKHFKFTVCILQAVKRYIVFGSKGKKLPNAPPVTLYWANLLIVLPDKHDSEATPHYFRTEDHKLVLTHKHQRLSNNNSVL